MAKVYISLGTNLGDKEHNLETAILEIQEHCGKVKQTSSIYSSAPWGFESFNNFLNQVVLIETMLSPFELMNSLLEIEKKLGRDRAVSVAGYQDRIIDLDILFYDDLILKKNNLTIPHPILHERNFVVQPLLEMNPTLEHPVLKKTIGEIASTMIDSSKAFKK